MIGKESGTLHVLLTGAGGQVGVAVRQRAPNFACVEALDSAALDVTDEDAVRSAVARLRPDVILNAAAFTAVDRAESEPDLAFRVNRDGAANLATAAARSGARIIQLSTDFVFDGAQDTPYHTDSRCHPINVYGASKLAGEEAVMERGGSSALIIRTSWLYAAHGRNFVRTMLHLMQQGQDVQVVDDQVGSPTWAVGLADAIWSAACRPHLSGLLHWSDAGATTWYELARTIQDDARALGLLLHRGEVYAIPTSDFLTAARRPPFSVLDTAGTAAALGLTPTPWRHNLRRMLEGLCSAA